MFVFEIFLVLIFPHSYQIGKDTEYVSVFSTNAGKYGTEKLRIRTLFEQCHTSFKNLLPLEEHIMLLLKVKLTQFALVTF